MSMLCKALLLLSLLFACCFGDFIDQKNDSFYLQHHSKLQALIQSSTKRAHLTRSEQFQVQEIVNKIENLGVELFDHEHALNALKSSRRSEKAKMGLFWWIHADHRIKIREHDLKVKDQQRQVENLKENIDLHWIKLKPFFGVFSEVI
jgi:hypothetical protein